MFTRVQSIRSRLFRPLQPPATGRSRRCTSFCIVRNRRVIPRRKTRPVTLEKTWISLELAGAIERASERERERERERGREVDWNFSNDGTNCGARFLNFHVYELLLRFVYHVIIPFDEREREGQREFRISYVVSRQVPRLHETSVQGTRTYVRAYVLLKGCVSSLWTFANNKLLDGC